MASQGSGGNVIAAICSIFFPGLGQLVQGRLLWAIFFFVATVVCYALWWTIVLGILAVLFHLWAILDAARFRSD